jgi:hypothetical protein
VAALLRAPAAPAVLQTVPPVSLAVSDSPQTTGTSDTQSRLEGTRMVKRKAQPAGEGWPSIQDSKKQAGIRCLQQKFNILESSSKYLVISNELLDINKNNT